MAAADALDRLGIWWAHHSDENMISSSCGVVTNSLLLPRLQCGVAPADAKVPLRLARVGVASAVRLSVGTGHEGS